MSATVSIFKTPPPLKIADILHGRPLNPLIYFQVSEVNTGTADQAVIEVSPSASNITMRTKSGDDDMSVESESCKIPISVKASLMKSVISHKPVLTSNFDEDEDCQSSPDGASSTQWDILHYFFFRFFRTYGERH